jgi:hypothetical protein
MLLSNLKTRATETEASKAPASDGSPRFARTLRPLLCLAAMLICALPSLANSATYGPTHHSSPSSFGKLLSPTTHTGSYSKSGLPRSTPRSAGPAARPVRSGQERQLDLMMKQDASLAGKANRDRSSTAKSYKPLSIEGSGQGSGINFSGRSNQTGRAKRR